VRFHATGNSSSACAIVGVAKRVLAIKPQKVEGVKDWLPFPAEQLIELADPLTIEAHNFAIENCVLHRQLDQRFFQRLKSQVALIARDDLAFSSLQVDNGHETVVFQLENVIGMVEGLPHQAEPHGVDAREHHSSLHAPPAGNMLWRNIRNCPGATVAPLVSG
jgi:hypothetical protein